jgi:hypothetical protein
MRSPLPLHQVGEKRIHGGVRTLNGVQRIYEQPRLPTALHFVAALTCARRLPEAQNLPVPPLTFELGDELADGRVERTMSKNPGNRVWRNSSGLAT